MMGLMLTGMSGLAGAAAGGTGAAGGALSISLWGGEAALTGALTVGISAEVVGSVVLTGTGVAGLVLFGSDGNGSGTNGKVPEGTHNTKHGNLRIEERGFSEDKIKDIMNNFSQKVYQEGGRTVYAKKNGNYYDVIITNANGDIVTAVGGNTKSLKTWKDVIKMLNNNGGYSSLPY